MRLKIQKIFKDADVCYFCIVLWMLKFLPFLAFHFRLRERQAIPRFQRSKVTIVYHVSCTWSNITSLATIGKMSPRLLGMITGGKVTMCMGLKPHNFKLTEKG